MIVTARNGKHVSGLLQLARLLVEINSQKDRENSTATIAFAEASAEVVTSSTTSAQVVDATRVARAWMEEVIELYESVIPNHKDPPSVVCEYTKVVNKYGSGRHKVE